MQDLGFRTLPVYFGGVEKTSAPDTLREHLGRTEPHVGQCPLVDAVARLWRYHVLHIAWSPCL